MFATVVCMKRIHFMLPDDVVEDVDRIAARLLMGRSRYLREAVVQKVSLDEFVFWEATDRMSAMHALRILSVSQMHTRQHRQFEYCYRHCEPNRHINTCPTRERNPYRV